MRCTNKRRYSYSRRRRIRRRNTFLAVACCLFVALSAILGILWLESQREYVIAYESGVYSSQPSQHPLHTDSLCVSTEDVTNDSVQLTGKVHAAGLFHLTDGEVLYAEDIHEKLYPASTTKLLTAYVAIKYGNLDDIVTVSSNAVGVPWDSSRAGFYVGDQVTLETLLYALMLPSGNDSAVAIAEHISGSEAEFAKLMNKEAALLGATNTHYVNAHGYQHEDHYTTAYDLHLIMKACTTQEMLMKVLGTEEYSTQITQRKGTYRNATWYQTNKYITGSKVAPEHVTVLGGKTGTTDEAGACLVLYEVVSDTEQYISIIMGAEDKAQLYNDMTGLLTVAAK